jgi:hypothetical protein
MLRALNPSPLRVRPACRSPPRRRAAAGVPQRPPVRRPSGDRLCAPWRGATAAPALGVDEGPAATGARGELDAFLEVVPARMRRGLARHPEVRELVEVVMDLGRRPIARFPSGDWVISDQPVTADDLRQAVSKVARTLFIFFSTLCWMYRFSFLQGSGSRSQMFGRENCSPAGGL